MDFFGGGGQFDVSSLLVIDVMYCMLLYSCCN